MKGLDLVRGEGGAQDSRNTPGAFHKSRSVPPIRKLDTVGRQRNEVCVEGRRALILENDEEY